MPELSRAIAKLQTTNLGKGRDCGEELSPPVELVSLLNVERKPSGISSIVAFVDKNVVNRLAGEGSAAAMPGSCLSYGPHFGKKPPPWDVGFRDYLHLATRCLLPKLDISHQDRGLRRRRRSFGMMLASNIGDVTTLTW